MAQSQVRLNASAFFWRAFEFVFIVTALMRLRRVWRRGPWIRRLFLVLIRLPRLVAVSVVLAALLTFLTALIIRLVVRPLVAYWHAPRVELDAVQFHLAANEWVVYATAGRRARGWHWPSGALVRTNLRLWFLPSAYESEVWSHRLDELDDVRLVPAPRGLGGTVLNWPERLLVRAGGDEEPQVFAVSEPHAVISWFKSAKPAAAKASLEV